MNAEIERLRSRIADLEAGLASALDKRDAWKKAAEVAEKRLESFEGQSTLDLGER